MHRSLALSLAGIALALALPAGAASDAEVAACIERNVPAPDSVRGVRITQRDPKAGTKRIVVLKMFGRTTPDGAKELLVRFADPEDVRGSSVLMLERGEQTEVYMATPELPEPRRVTHRDRGSTLFGTDLSLEDLQWMEGFRLPDASKRKPDSKVDLYDAYVVESEPGDSSYSRVISYVDQETCLPLRMELFGKNGRIRKELTTDRRAHIRHGEAWVAHDMLIRDIRDLTSTHFMVDAHEQDVMLSPDLFGVDGLRQAVLEDPAVRMGAP